MKNVLYIGNALSSKGKTITTIETLGARLGEFCNVRIASKKRNKFFRLLDMIKLVVMNRTDADYVLIDTYSTTNFYYAFFISKLCKWFNLRYISILHGGNLESRLKKSPKLSASIFKNAYSLVSPSIFLQKAFKKYDYKDVKYIPNSLEIENYQFRSRKIQTIRLLWVRSFSKIYNPEQAVLVLDDLLKRGYQAELIMVGPEIDGSMEKTKALAKDKNVNINFTGKLTKKEWIELSKESNVFINTTSFDNMPVSIIEAMALGLPVVSTNVGGLPFLISHKFEGLLVPPMNIKSMTDAIIVLKDDDVFKEQLIVNARNKVEQLDWKKIKPLWENLLS